jgi:hypothetical protein
VRYNLLIYTLLFLLLIILNCDRDISPLQSEGKISLEEALDIVINKVIQDDTTGKAIYANPEIISSSDTIFVLTKEFYTFDFDSWFFFVDDMVLANWSHPCRYVFVNINNKDYEVRSSHIYPTCYRDLILVRIWPKDLKPNYDFNATP